MQNATQHNCSIIRNNTLWRRDFLLFCEQNFDNAPYLKPANLSDWHPNPPMFDHIFDEEMRLRRIAFIKRNVKITMPFVSFKRKFAVALHQIWSSLAREFIDDVHREQARYPVLSVPNRFVVPGGFFNLFFYWDTLWILKGSFLFDVLPSSISNHFQGLYFCNLTATAHGMLENFAHVLRFHGFIPNSGNVQ